MLIHGRRVCFEMINNFCLILLRKMREHRFKTRPVLLKLVFSLLRLIGNVQAQLEGRMEQGWHLSLKRMSLF